MRFFSVIIFDWVPEGSKIQISILQNMLRHELPLKNPKSSE